jgi:hypothetical protein
MNAILLRGVALGLAFAVLAPAVWGDTIVTTSRRTFTGKVLEEAPDKVVIRTDSGNVTVPRAIITVLDKGRAAGPAAAILPDKVAPADAANAFEEAKAALAKANWVRAGCLLEGLLELAPMYFPQENRLAATAALATCYLQVKDAAGAGRAFRRRAELVAADSDKRRLLATAEAIGKSGGPAIGGKPITTYDEAIAAAMDWKAAQLVAEAREAAAKAAALNDPEKIEAAGRRCLDRLGEADTYVPGTSAARRKEVFAALADNVFQAARRGVEKCTADRKDLSRYWQTSAADVKYAVIYNGQVSRYLGLRQAAEDGLKNFRAVSAKFQVPELYTEREKDCAALLAQLEELQYHVLLPGMPRQLKIAPRRIGSPFQNG